MRSKIITIVTFLFLVFSSSAPVLAQTIPPVASPTSSAPISLPTSPSCGLIGNACCPNFQFSTLPKLPSPNIGIPGISNVVDVLVGFVNSFIGLTDPLVKPVADFVNQIKGDKVCAEGLPSDEKNLANCTCLPKESFNIANLCIPISNQQEKQACISCSKEGVWTAIGCVDFKLDTFLKNTLFGWGIGLAGIIALLCIIWSAINMQISQGNSEKLKKAQENLTSCILGLILIIFSVLILRVIGVDILKIPGFG